MGLFDFLKKKKEVAIDINGDLKEVIRHGIVFESIGLLMPWGSDTNALLKAAKGREKRFADRLVYEWGEQTILKGLKLELNTTYWYHQETANDRTLSTLSFAAIGDDTATAYFDKINAHLLGLFGEARYNEISETETILKWLVNDVKFYLRFYKQHRTNKLQFEISV